MWQALADFDQSVVRRAAPKVESATLENQSLQPDHDPTGTFEYRIVCAHLLVPGGLLKIVGRGKNVSALLQCIFILAAGQQTGGCRICPCVVQCMVCQPELVIVDTSSREGLDGELQRSAYLVLQIEVC